LLENSRVYDVIVSWWC